MYFLGMYLLFLAHQLCTTGKAGLDTTLLAGTGFSSFLPSFLPLFVELCAPAGGGTALEISSCYYFLVFCFQILFLYFGFNRKSQSVFCSKKVDEIWLLLCTSWKQILQSSCRNSSCALQHSSRELAE
jgi:hypothetical protein